MAEFSSGEEKIQGDPGIACWTWKQGDAQRQINYGKGWQELVWRGSHWSNLGNIRRKRMTVKYCNKFKIHEYKMIKETQWV